jgi:hypothetical protein
MLADGGFQGFCPLARRGRRALLQQGEKEHRRQRRESRRKPTGANLFGALELSPSAAAVAACMAAALLSCGGARSPIAARATPMLDPQWQDVFDSPPMILVAVRPDALRRDTVYGPLLRRVLDLARERTRIVTATRMIDAIVGADEVLVGLDSDGPEPTGDGDLVVVVIGVRADVDPAEIVDGDGHPQWSPGPSGQVRELVRQRDEPGPPIEASLFELPGRTWVIASGPERDRVRDVFARPRGRKDPVALDPDALAVLRMDGRSLVSRVPVLRPPSALSAVGRAMRSLTLELTARTTTPVRAILDYATPDEASAAELAVRTTIDAIRREKPPRLGWLSEATVDRGDAGTRVTVAVALPAAIMAGLLGRSGVPNESGAAPHAVSKPALRDAM